MASFDSHILQAKNNLDFLLAINLINNINWDWQVTIAYYVGVHIVNAHIIGTSNMHYRAHHEVKNELYNDAEIPEDIYLAYAKLEGLSRRARYLSLKIQITIVKMIFSLMIFILQRPSKT